MLILLFKLFITPTLITTVTLAGRYWGAVASGLLMGLPLTSGPISFILALEYGPHFASQSAIGNLAGQVSNFIFCLTYIALARSRSWKICSVMAVLAFSVSTTIFNFINWGLWSALAFLLSSMFISTRFIKHHNISHHVQTPPKWDLPGRIFCATLLVLVLTAAADFLGPTLSGLIAPVPIFLVIFATFTHVQQGEKATSNLLRGVIVGSGGYATFYTVVGVLLATSSVFVTYLIATSFAIAIGGVIFLLTKRRREKRCVLAIKTIDRVQM